MSLPRFTLRYSNIVMALLLVAVVVGALKYVSMPRRADPAFTIRACQVVTRWPGAEARRVEQQITRPLEETIGSLAEVDYITSTSRTGQSVLQVILEDAVPVGEIQQVWDRVRAKIETVKPTLPRGASSPSVNDEFGDTTVMLIALYESNQIGPDADAPRYNSRGLEIVAERLQEQLGLLEGVAKVDIHGALTDAIFLEVSQGQWANVGFNIDRLQALMRERNIDSAGGSIDTDRSRLGIQPTGEFDAVDQIRTVIVDREHGTGAPIYLHDVGIQTRRGFEDPPRVTARFGNTRGSAPCVIVDFTMKDGTNVIELGERVRTLLTNMKEKDKTIPADVTAEVVFDESVFVDAKISDFLVNVIEAIVIVLAVAYLMAGWRSAVIMAVAIPFVMIISIGLSSFLGVELEQMSIASLIIALGMLVDNAVVVCDNVTRHRNLGNDAVEGTVRGVDQVMYPMLMGTLTTVFAFLPLAFFLPGNKGEYVFSIPVVVSITLLSSWVLALTLSTLNAYWLIKPAKEGEVSPLAWIAGLIARPFRRKSSTTPPRGLTDHYASAIGACLRAKPVVLGVTLAMLIGAVSLPISSDFFPSDKRDLLYVDVWLPEGSSFAATDQATAQVEKLMAELSPTQIEGESVQRLTRYYSSIGGSGPRFALGVNPQPPASNFAQIIAQTSSTDVTDSFVQELLQAAEEKLPGVRVIPRKLALGPPVDAPLGIRVYSAGYTQPGFGDIGELRAQAEKIKDAFRKLDGVWDVHDTWGDEGFELEVDIHEDRANLAGVTNQAVASTLSAYYSGYQLTTLREGNHHVPVYLRLPPTERDALIDPRAIFVEGRTGKVPLDVVADVNRIRTTTKIERRDKNRMIEVRARVREGVLPNDKLNEAMPAIRQIESTLPPGYYLEVAGTMEESSEAQGEMSGAFGAAIVLIILCLIVQYNSFVKPLVILMTIPMGAIGAFLGLYITDNPLGFMPMLGLVSLAGVVVNAGILYLEFADTLIQESVQNGQGVAMKGEKSYLGLSLKAFRQCLAEAGKQRLQPILLTVGTTVAGLLPLALFGGPLWEAMAWLLIFGLLVATVLTLLVLPVIYAAFVEWFRAGTSPES